MFRDTWTLSETKLERGCLLCDFDERRHVQEIPEAEQM
jgi:hypothetical protein